jgi:hypothetical protein
MYIMAYALYLNIRAQARMRVFIVNVRYCLIFSVQIVKLVIE